MLAHERTEVDDLAAAAVKFCSGALVLLEGSASVFTGYCARLGVYGGGGSVIIETE
jgi:UDP-N-acetyl-2-amino-2-deoxyglucuronate dehydrogenase